MATHRIPIVGWSSVPDTSGNVWFEPSSIKLTNDLFPHLIAVFKDTATKVGLNLSFVVPKNFVSAPKIGIIWAANNVAASNVVWETTIRAIADTESMDPTTVQETATVTTAAATTVWLRTTSLLTLTAGNFAIDDLVQARIARDGTSGSDTMAQDAVVFAAFFEYADA